MGIKENVRSLKDEISEAALKAGRKPEEITLVAVSKTFSEDKIMEACEAGLNVFGENRVQEAEAKILNLKDKFNIEWHLVGHLQSNKAKKAVPLFEMIQSIDSLETLKKIDRLAEENQKKQSVLIEINTSGEASKFGIRPEETEDFLIKAADLINIEISGLMTIGPFTDDTARIRDSFLMLKDLYDKSRERFPEMPFNHLSMGMTGDFKTAIECGSNMIRVGRRIFGQRS